LLADRIAVLKEGRISLDTPVALDRPRVLGGREFDALRARLLAELGVIGFDGTAAIMEGAGDPPTRTEGAHDHR
jgi:hypothetical protein